MSRKIIFLLLLILVLGFSSLVYAIPPELKSQFHDINLDQVTLVINKDNRDVIWQLRDNPNLAQIIGLKLRNEDLETEQMQILERWVEIGGTLWIHQNYFKDHFGVKYVGTSHFSNPLDKNSGALADHPVNTGVDKINCYYRAGGWGYKGIDLIPVINGKENVILGEIMYGQGRVIFDNVSEIKDYDAERWWLNFKEWMLGYPVPGAIPRARITEVKGYDRVLLNSGEVIDGYVLNESFVLRAFYGQLTFREGEIASIIFRVGGPNNDQVFLRNGDRLSGLILDDKISIKLTSGSEIILDKSDINTITFSFPR